MQHAQNLTDADFEDLIEEHPVVLVDFWGHQCAPCRQMAPIVDELAFEVGNRALVGKLNVQENPIATHDAGIRGVPTFIVYRDGKAVSQHLGRASKKDLLNLIALAEGLVTDED